MSDKLSIIILGSPHAEFTIYSVLTRLFQKLHSKQIPCAFLEENPSDQTLEMIKKSTRMSLTGIQHFKELVPEIKKLYIQPHSSQYAYIPTDNYDNLIKAIDQTNFSPSIANQLVTEILRENAYVEEVKLYEKLEQLQIHYAGIEAPTFIHNQQMEQINRSEQDFYNNEPARITTMVNNTLKEISEHFRNGGVIIISTGGSHAHRLAANLWQEFQSIADDSLDINIHPFRIFSSYSKGIKSISDYNLELTASLDSPEIVEIYNKLPYPDVESREKNHTYFIPEVEAIIDNLLEKRPVHINSNTFLSSLFTPLTAHDQLLRALKEYFTKKPHKNSASLITLIDRDKNYSLAFRKVCAAGMVSAVKLFVKYGDELSIDFNETSSNGNTALAWFNKSQASPAEKKEIRILLKDKMLKLEVSEKTQDSIQASQ